MFRDDNTLPTPTYQLFIAVLCLVLKAVEFSNVKRIELCCQTIQSGGILAVNSVCSSADSYLTEVVEVGSLWLIYVSASSLYIYKAASHGRTGNHLNQLTLFLSYHELFIGAITPSLIVVDVSASSNTLG
jgi:hypothetical protein